MKSDKLLTKLKASNETVDITKHWEDLRIVPSSIITGFESILSETPVKRPSSLAERISEKDWDLLLGSIDDARGQDEQYKWESGREVFDDKKALALARRTTNTWESSIAQINRTRRAAITQGSPRMAEEDEMEID